MSEEIEIEFKNMLTEEEYQRLMNEFVDKQTSNCSSLFKQTNYYFDTLQFDLKKQLCALRIRYKNGKYMLTLKEPHEKGLLETNQRLSEQAAKQALINCSFPSGAVTEKLKKRLKDAFASLTYLGELHTERTEIKIDEGILVFDKNKYLNHIDFELEFECSNWEKGKVFFYHFLNEYNIPKRKTPNKILRFMNEKKKTGGGK